MKSLEYKRHLEKHHGVIFGMKEIMKEGEKNQSFPPNEEPDQETRQPEPKTFRTDADIVKEMVEMKYLSKRRTMRLRSPRQRLFSRKYKVLSNEEQELPTPL